MYQDFSYETVLAASHRAAWQIEDVIARGDALDFSRPFMPESLARTTAIERLEPTERLLLNQIRGHEYLCIFGLVEEFILPFVLDHARPHLSGDDHRVRALLQFAGEEAKHIQLFKRFNEAFERDFEVDCAMIGPAKAIGAEVLRHDPLAVALTILQIEWMTQGHYVDSVRDDAGLDPLFKSLLKHHWMEEAQHAKLDTLMVEALAEGRDAAGIERAVEEYLDIGLFIDAGLKAQTAFNLAALEQASGRALGAGTRKALLAQQHQAARWTYLGSGMVHPKFRATLAVLSPAARDRIDAVAPHFS
ncbi:diiron oxygenase [Allosphingosinicella humi]